MLNATAIQADPVLKDGTQLRTVMDRLNQGTTSLHNAVMMLEVRLLPLLSPPNNVASINEQTNPPQPVRSPLAAMIDEQSDAVYGLTLRVDALLERLAH